MPIDNANLLAFVNESVRTTADRLAGLLPLPDQLINAVVGRGFAEVLGTTNTELLRETPWTDEDYAAITPEVITGSDSGGRTLLTNHHVIGIIRVLVVLQQMVAANPALGPLIGAVAVNPRA